MVDQPLYTPAERQSRETFLALMWCLSYPGRLKSLPQSRDAFQLIASTLLDLETSFYTPDDKLHTQLAATGARALAPDRAAYHFYPTVISLHTIEAASLGTMQYPDEAATLIIGGTLTRGTRFRLSGPGINGDALVTIDDIHADLWDLRRRVIQYPLGWDIFIVDLSANVPQVLGLPRSTTMTRE